MGGLLKVTALKSEGQVASGMWMEIHKKGSSNGPSFSEIRKGITEKYKLKTPPSNSNLFKSELL